MGKGAIHLLTATVAAGAALAVWAEDPPSVAVKEYDTGGVYEGPFVNGLPHGEGMYTTPDGDIARGRVVEGKPDGKIVFTLKDGGTREEIWENGKKVK